MPRCGGRHKKRLYERQRRRVDRRELIRTLALGAGSAVLASTVLGGEDPDPEPDLNGQYYVDDDGYGYLIIGFTAQDVLE